MVSRGTFGRAVALLGAAAVLGTAVAACGGGGSTTSAASPELTKSQFVKQATAICQKSAEEKAPRLEAAIKSEGGEGLFSASAAELETLASKVVLPLYGEAFSHLGRLNPPSKDKARVAKILDEYETALKGAEADPAAALKANPFAKADEAAAAYGFNCLL